MRSIPWITVIILQIKVFFYKNRLVTGNINVRHMPKLLKNVGSSICIHVDIQTKTWLSPFSVQIALTYSLNPNTDGHVWDI